VILGRLALESHAVHALALKTVAIALLDF